MPDPRAGDLDRSIAFDAVFNFRDLGGYPTQGGATTRWRRLFRADGLNRLQDHEAEQVRALGIRTVIDLRTPEEAEAHGRFPQAIAPVEYHSLPLFDVQPDWSGFQEPDAPGFLADRYVEMLETGRASVATALHLLAEPAAYPLVFHCAAGKDRTGILAAVVLGLLDVPDAVIIEDYALSHEATQRMFAWVRANGREADSTYQAPPASVIAALPDTMARFLGHLAETHGGPAGLVADLGIEPAVVKQIQAQLLDR
ncbi:MAG: hypothetical protein NVSMB12_11190 [Acidimicrobiales bacterium]